MANEVFLTKNGYKDLEKRLEDLKVIKRKEIAEKIKIAREYGDISENAEYDAAKDEQAMIEGEILEIEQKLRTAIIISDKAETKGIVSMGSTVKVLDIEFNEELVFTIVGTTEANPADKKISNEAPVAMALLGKKKGEQVVVNAPSGEVKLKIIDIN